MALPKLEVPTYDLELPISKKTIRFRPFLVKEQKILLMAMESNDKNTIQNAIVDILKVCISGDVKLEDLSVVDVEYIFLNLRAKSVSEIVETKYRCNNEVPDVDGKTKECGGIIESKIDLTKVKPVIEKEVDPVIVLTDKITVKMKYPTFSSVKDSSMAKDISKMTLELIASCIEYIYDGDQYYYTHETPIEETVEFIESLNQNQFEKIEEYFNSMPKLKQKVSVKCKKCGYLHEFELEGIQSFFG
jgi:hypothetical protein